jgi:hypothetical protein
MGYSISPPLATRRRDLFAFVLQLVVGEFPLISWQRSKATRGLSIYIQIAESDCMSSSAAISTSVKQGLTAQPLP